MLVDRVGLRLPDHVRAEGGLGMHLDRNPFDPELRRAANGRGGESRLTKFRPIQAFVALTDQYGGESGGLRVVRGFQHDFDSYFAAGSASSTSTGGEFYRLNDKAHTALSRRLEPVDAPAGALVCWDNRLPHATAAKLTSDDTREVVYVSALPDIALNRRAILAQADAIRSNRPPPVYAGDDVHEQVDRDWQLDELDEYERRLLAMDGGEQSAKRRR